MRGLLRSLAAFVVALLIPAASYAQASIAGVVRDTSGAVLPGVTVEAASPALIEKVRTVVSDGAGQYRIVDLRAGTYSVTFTLPGFNTVKREGVELAGNFNANVSVEMRVGALEETITVTGAAPVVDVQSTRQQQVLDREVIRDLPTNRQYYSVAALIPGVVVPGASGQDVGGTGMIATISDYVIHGGKIGDGRLLVDGLTVGSAYAAGANRTQYVINVGVQQETTVTTSGGLGEAETSGMVMNFVPREGGNTVRGSIFGNFANSAMQGSNFTDELRAAGVRRPNEITRMWEFTPQVGGPIRRDKLWYLVSYKNQGLRDTLANMWHDKNSNDPTKWTYEPDFDRPAKQDGTWKSASIRLTWQASPRNKVNVFWDEQDRKTGWLGGGSQTASPDGFNMAANKVARVAQSSWSSPRTNRLLFEAAYGHHLLMNNNSIERPGYNRAMIPVQELSGIIPGITYRGISLLTNNTAWTHQARASVSYVTGTHSMKVGYTKAIYTRHQRDNDLDGKGGISYRFFNGVPIQLTLQNRPRDFKFWVLTEGVYAQDSWVLGRLTLQGGVRYDHNWNHFPENRFGFNRFIPNGFVLPEADGMKFHDITPRLAASYDLRGDGRTALKVTLGKFVLAQDGGLILGELAAPYARRPSATTVAWRDVDRDFEPDCDLLNRLANGECGPYANQTFGLNISNRTYDENLIYGWGKRPYNWEFSTQVQHELIPRVGLNVGYFRRWFGNFVVTDNRAVSLADFDTFSVPVPADPRLPDGGGSTLTGLYEVKPEKFGLTDDYVTHAKNFGKWTERWNGVDLSINARAINGVTVSGGVSTGRRTENFCDIRSQLPEVGILTSAITSVTTPALLIPFCNITEPFLTQFKGLASYVIPRIDVLVSGTMQSTPGPILAANFNVPNAIAAQSLGRPFSGGAQTRNVNILEPGALLGDRVTQLDIRIAKVLTYGGTRTNVGIDLYNALNANPITGYNQTLGPRWLLPTQIMPARFIKVSAQLDF